MQEGVRDYGYEAHRAAIKRWEELEEARYAEESGEVEPEWPEDMLSHYCGCEDCVVRELLHAAWPFLRLAALENLS